MHDAVRSARSKETLSLGLVVLTVLAWGALSIGSASGSCAGPSLRLDMPGSRYVPVVAAGSTEVITGSNWFSQCNDTPGPCQRGGVSGPIEGVQVGIVPARGPDGRSDRWKAEGPIVPIGTRDAGADGTFRIDGVTMPSRPGKYFLVGTAPASGGGTYRALGPFVVSVKG